MEGQHEVLQGSLSELIEIRRLLEALLMVDSGEFVAVPLPWRLGVNGDQFKTWSTEGGEFAAVQIDNPNGSTVEVRFDGVAPTTADADARVPAHTGRIIVRKFDAISVGFDPSVNLGGAATPVFVTVYSRPVTPASYPYAP